jgi:hypothetical protein
MRADDGEVEFFGEEEVFGDALYVVCGYFVYAFYNFFHRTYTIKIDDRCRGKLRELIRCFALKY